MLERRFWSVQLKNRLSCSNLRYFANHSECEKQLSIHLLTVVHSAYTSKSCNFLQMSSFQMFSFPKKTFPFANTCTKLFICHFPRAPCLHDLSVTFPFKRNTYTGHPIRGELHHTFLWRGWAEMDVKSIVSAEFQPAQMTHADHGTLITTDAGWQMINRDSPDGRSFADQMGSVTGTPSQAY